MPEVLESAAAVAAWRDAGGGTAQRVALVPTMGYLHEGHLQLVRLAKDLAPRVLVSIFVNPTQFGANEDLDRYPRDVQGDLRKLTAAGADAVYVPSAADIYPDGFDTFVVPERLAGVLCGKSRPGHFRGVCTVVCVLFRVTGCAAAVFGEKDFQQLQIIRRMNRDLRLGVEIVGAPIVREADGLAMSSRNALLSETERRDARVLFQALQQVQRRAREGERRASALREAAHAILRGPASVRVDYVELFRADDLQPIAGDIPENTRCAVAAFVGQTRLIDNAPVT